MKNYCLIFFAVLLLSCQKSKLKKDIVGVWELEKVAGWVVGNPYPPGAVTFIIKEDGTFQHKLYDSVTSSGTYEIRTQKDCHPRSTDKIFWTNQPGVPYYIELGDDKLTLSTSFCLVETWSIYYKRLR